MVYTYYSELSFHQELEFFRYCKSRVGFIAFGYS